MSRLIVLGLLLAGCGGQPGIEGNWQTVEMATVVRAGDPLPTGATLRFTGDSFTATGVEHDCREVGSYELAGVGLDPYGAEGTEVNLQPVGCGQPRALVWRGDTLWLRGEREGTFVVAFVRR